ncbi:M20 family metallopeptidase [Rhodococcus sp. ARC_M6]|uniref:M20 family metallopeptidase n=1 Tax=Rhodococcus sp. ARC_M6 TaxID=2928852 RepID=UPI001FB3E799|nr:M20 family metallopeptidase [Rhodococcus sp. ARC_M6]MCJ0902059.1 M20 family metallopeptidase [Rhodococcus sp. ARC_M6]
MTTKERAAKHLDTISDAALALSHQIHEDPELAFAEHNASAAVADMLEGAGFSVERGVAGLPTALSATYGTGDLVIGLFAEYDALPDIGHACGHNIIASAAVTAGLLLAPLADELGITVAVFGTPAEEGGGGKVLMLDEGIFDSLHCAMMVHPGAGDLRSPNMLAISHLDVAYTGVSSHASFAVGAVNAADAFTVAQVGIGLLRQHLPKDVQVHGYVSNAGIAPNVIPGSSHGEYAVRAETLDGVVAAKPKVEQCFTAGAIATGCDIVMTSPSPAYAESRWDAQLSVLYQENVEALGRTFFEFGGPAAGSTDMGNVSHRIPTIHPIIGLECNGTGNHQAEFTRYCRSETGDKAVLDGALGMAWTAIDCASDSDLRARLLGRP